MECLVLYVGMCLLVYHRREVSKDPLGSLSGEIVAASWASTYFTSYLYYLTSSAESEHACTKPWISSVAAVFTVLRQYLYQISIWLQMKLVGDERRWPRKMLYLQNVSACFSPFLANIVSIVCVLESALRLRFSEPFTFH